eukprot:234333-Pyramimonas_sp.AAC.1
MFTRLSPSGKKSLCATTHCTGPMQKHLGGSVYVKIADEFCVCTVPPPPPPPRPLCSSSSSATWLFGGSRKPPEASTDPSGHVWGSPWNL